MNEWIDELSDLTAAGEPAVLVTVAGIRGSAPREIGAKMIVTASETIGTIGGGQLEYQSTRVAVGMLDEEQLALRSFPLGSSMGQCCGGVVEILFEPVAGGMPAWLRDLRRCTGSASRRRRDAHFASAPVQVCCYSRQVFGATKRMPTAWLPQRGNSHRRARGAAAMCRSSTNPLSCRLEYRRVWRRACGLGGGQRLVGTGLQYSLDRQPPQYLSRRAGECARDRGGRACARGRGDAGRIVTTWS